MPFVSGKTPPNGTNFGHIANSQYTSNATKAAVAPDVATACPLWETAEESLYKNFDLVQMYDFYVSVYLKNAQASIQGGELDGSSLRLTQGWRLSTQPSSQTTTRSRQGPRPRSWLGCSSDIPRHRSYICTRSKFL